MTHAEWIRAVDTLAPLRRFAIRLALMFVGHNETGENVDSDGFIAGLLARCGIDSPVAWCAAFLSFVLGVTPSASALVLTQRYKLTESPLPGDVFSYPTDAAGHGHGHGHCGLIAGVSPAMVATIEGNSGNAVRFQQRWRTQPGIKFYRVFPIGSAKAIPGVIDDLPTAGSATR